jgi:uncharacterized protein (DUF4213/DUF364 family)
MSSRAARVSSILDELLASIAEDAPVRDVLVGARWTVVCSRRCGMAASLMPAGPHAGTQVHGVGHLHEKSALELAQLARSADLLEASIGVAALNSLLDVDPSGSREINAGDLLLQRGRDRDVALIGHFHFIPQLRQSARNLWVIEQQPVDDEYPAEAAVELLPKADVVAITGSAFVNHTLDGLLACCNPASTVMILGPSTPLSPVFFAHGIHLLSGTLVVDEPAVLRTVSQGATFRQVEGVKLLTFVHEGTQ